MNEFLTKTFYGNTILEWTASLSIIFGSFVLGKILYWIFESFLKKLSARSETKLDDLLIDNLKAPATLAIILLGIRFGLSYLNLPEKGNLWINRIYHILFVINASWFLVRMIDTVYSEFIVPMSAKLDAELNELILPLLRKGTKFLIWTLGIIIGMNNAGYDVGAFLAGLGIGGVAIALAARSTLSNIFGGITIFIDQPFKINDKIRVKSRVHGIEGKVGEVGLRQTKLVTGDGSCLWVPNSIFATDPVENVSQANSIRTSYLLKISKKNSFDKIETAMAVLKEVGSGEEMDSAPVIGVQSIESGCIELLFIYFIRKNLDDLAVQTSVNLKLLKKFKENEIEWAENFSDSGSKDGFD